MKKNSLFNRFIIQSIISFVITGALLAYFVTNIIITIEVNHNIEIVSLTLGHSLNHWFEEVDINDLSESDIIVLDDEFFSLRELGNIADIRIWHSDGSLAYSQIDSLIGNQTLENEHLDIALSDNIVYEIITPDTYENEMLKKYGNELIEIYLPIYIDDEVKGVFEVYRSFDDSRSSINSSIRFVLLILSSGLLFLYFFLARVIYVSSNKLMHQSSEIISKNDELESSHKKQTTLYRSMIKAITNAIDARDSYTSGHSQRVADQTVSFAKYLNLDDPTINSLEIAAQLHDIGKLGVPESVLNNPSKLTDEEFNLIKEHPSIGERIIHDIAELEDIVNVIKYHHERYSGDGYPEKLLADDIPYMARI
nr:HD domain-containing protein [Vallitaleaceae bacterium]